MRKLFTLVCLSLCLCLAAPALAVPCRDERTLTDGGAMLETAVSLFGGASLMRDVYAVNEGEAVPQTMIEGALLLGYGRHLLPNVDGDPADAAETVSAAAAEALLPQLFAGTAAIPETPSCPCITRSGDTLTFDISDVDVETASAAKVFSAWEENGRMTVLADLYSAIAYYGEDLEQVSEEYITWIRTAQFVLERDPNALLGYRLVAMNAYPDWLDGALSEWELTLGEDYEVNLPAFFALASSEDGTDVYTADGLDAALTVQIVPASGQDPLDTARREYAAAHPEAAIVMEPALSHFTAETDGAYVLYVWPEGADTLHVVTLTFPPERQYEFSFYGEIIRNSFYCEGMGLG